MSLVDLTRHAFQSGTSAAKWIELCKLFLTRSESSIPREATETMLSNSVLTLFRFYPADNDLLDYLNYALRNGLLSTPIFVATLLQAARSTELHHAATLDLLCRVALDFHYSTTSSSPDSLIWPETPSTVLTNVLLDSFALLRTAYALTNNHFHQLTVSCSELVQLLVSCFTNFSQIPASQAMVPFAEANTLLHNYQLIPELREILENFILSLSLVIGDDDAKAVREAQMMQSMLSLSKSDIRGGGSTSSNATMVTFGLILHHLVTHRAAPYGCSNSTYTVALLLAIYRSSSWTPETFYTQLLLSAFTIMSQPNELSPMHWKAFALGRLPHLLNSFEQAASSETVSSANWTSALQAALVSLFSQVDLMTQCHEMLARSPTMNPDVRPNSIFREFLQQLLSAGLVAQRFAVGIDATLANDTVSLLQAEARDANMEITSYLESRLVMDMDNDSAIQWMNQLWEDSTSHTSFSIVVIRRFSALVGTLEAEELSKFCAVLRTHHAALDILSLHVRISDLVYQGLLFLEEYDCETVGDPQTAMSHIGDVVLFLQYILARFHVGTQRFSSGQRTLSSDCLQFKPCHCLLGQLTADENSAFHAWFKTLFDSSSDGVEDSILRSTPPKILLRISAPLVSEAIATYTEGKIDRETLNNGISYFTNPLLNWTLVVVVQALLLQIERKSTSGSICLEILQTLVLASSCPKSVLSLCSSSILCFVEKQKKQTGSIQSLETVAALERALGGGSNSQVTDAVNMDNPWQNYPRRVLEQALSYARAGKAPWIDIDCCIRMMGPTHFLHLMYAELFSVSGPVGDAEIGKKVATFVLTMARVIDKEVPPLLPIFLNTIVPIQLSSTESQQPAEQARIIELLSSIISSALITALHIDISLRAVGEDFNMGQTTAAMAKRLSMELRARKSSVGNAIAGRLSSSQAFVANFPVFIGEVGL